MSSKVYIPYVYKKWSYDSNESFLLARLPEWLNNFRVSKETIGFNLTIHDLPRIKNSALIIDSPFTGSMERQLKDLKGYQGALIICDRALWKLTEYLTHNFTGRAYVVNVDSSYLTTSFFDRPDVRKVMPYMTAIFSVTCFPLTIRAWSGSRCYFSPHMGSYSLTALFSEASRTDILVTGGCVHNTSWSIASALGAKVIGLYGIDNSFDSLRQTEYPSIKHKKIYVEELEKDFYVDPTYEVYADRMFNFIKNIRIPTINCGENGIMYNSVAKEMGYNIDIKRMSLKKFVETYN